MRLTKDMAELPQAMALLRHFTEANGISIEVLDDLLVVTDEVLTNCIEHGFIDKQAHWIDFSIQFDGRVITLEFLDNGIEFNPLDQAEPDLERPVDQRPEGGMGIVLVKALTSTQHYAYEQGCNVLQLTRQTGRGSQV